MGLQTERAGSGGFLSQQEQQQQQQEQEEEEEEACGRARGPALLAPPARPGPERDPERGPRPASPRDPRGLNAHLQLGFEDVIAEPPSAHTFDSIWIFSHAFFELSKYIIYKLLTVVLAIPLAFVAGLVFATLSCLHIWIVMPFVKTCLMVLPSVQAVWKSGTSVLVAPLCQSFGKIFSSVRLRLGPS
uniref:Caveolin n=1 Tax=Ornithorhynchus anatinus TaxID=9258 RepID=Q07E03_ORNAN|nr:caveolin 2 [Ornithorhynchus anatinus]